MFYLIKPHLPQIISLVVNSSADEKTKIAEGNPVVIRGPTRTQVRGYRGRNLGEHLRVQLPQLGKQKPLSINKPSFCVFF